MKRYRNRRVCRKCHKVFYCSYTRNERLLCKVENGSIRIDKCVGPCCVLPTNGLWSHCLTSLTCLTKAEKDRFFRYLMREGLFWEYYRKAGLARKQLGNLK